MKIIVPSLAGAGDPEYAGASCYEEISRRYPKMTKSLIYLVDLLDLSSQHFPFFPNLEELSQVPPGCQLDYSACFWEY